MKKLDKPFSLGALSGVMYRAVISALVSLGLLLCLFVVLVSVNPKLIFKKEIIEKHLTRLVGKPLSYKRLSIHWPQLIPVVRLHEVVILDEEKKQALLKLKQFSVGIDVWHSLIGDAIKPSILNASDGRIIIQTEKLEDKQQQATLKRQKEFFAWLLKPKVFQLKNIQVVFKENNVLLSTAKIFYANIINQNDKHLVNWHSSFLGSSFTQSFNSAFEKKNNNLWQGVLSWNLSGGKRTFKDTSSRVKSTFSIFRANEKQKWQVKLNAKYEVKHLIDLIPLAADPQKLGVMNVLDKIIKSAKTISGYAQYQGKLGELFAMNSLNQWQVQANFNGITLDYLKQWPKINNLGGQLFLKNDRLDIKVTHGDMNQIKLEPSSLSIADISSDKAWVNLHSAMRVHLPQDWEFLYQGKLKQHFKLLNSIDLHGLVGAKLNMQFPLKNPLKNIQVDGKIKLNLSKFNLIGWKLELSNVNGDLFFSSEQLDSANISATFLDEPIKVKLKAVEKFGEEGSSQLQVNGVADVQKLMKRFNIGLLKTATGKTKYQADVILNHSNKKHNEVKLSSDLIGVEVNLPAPLEKNPTEKKSLNLTAKFGGPGEASYFLTYGTKLSLYLLYMQKNNKYLFSRGVLNFGSTKIGNIPSKNLLIEGTLKNFSTSKWAKFFVREKHDKDKETGVSYQLTRANIWVQNFEIFGYYLKNARLKLKRSKTASYWQVKSKGLSGQIVKPYDTKKPVNVRLSHFFYESKKHTERKRRFSARNMPNLNLKISNFYFNKNNFGKLNLQTRTVRNQVKIKTFSLKNRDFTLSANGYWHGGHRDKTYMRGYLLGKNLAKILAYLDMPGFIKSNKLTFNFAFDWLASPTEFQLKKLRGRAYLTIKEGVISKIPKEQINKLRIARLLTLLKLEALPENLTSNLLFFLNKGFKFEKFYANLFFNRGVVSTKNTYLDSQILYAMINGQVNLIKKQYNFALTIEPYLLSSAPVVVALAGSPAAGGILWITQKIFKKQFRKIIRYQYQVVGPWDNPKLIERKN